MATNVSEKQARDVAEAAREAEWKLPSFGKELFLGDFRLDLIHPQPPADPEAVEKGERFLAQLREFLENEVDPLEIERDAKIPDDVVDGLKRIGALGMKIPEEYGGLGPLAGLLQQGAVALVGVWHSRRRDAALRAPVDRRGRAAADVRLRGAEARVAAAGRHDHISAFLLTEPDVGSDPARMATTATPVEGGYVAQRHASCGRPTARSPTSSS